MPSSCRTPDGVQGIGRTVNPGWRGLAPASPWASNCWTPTESSWSDRPLSPPRNRPPWRSAGAGSQAGSSSPLSARISSRDATTPSMYSTRSAGVRVSVPCPRPARVRHARTGVYRYNQLSKNRSCNLGETAARPRRAGVWQPKSGKGIPYLGESAHPFGKHGSLSEPAWTASKRLGLCTIDRPPQRPPPCGNRAACDARRAGGGHRPLPRYWPTLPGAPGQGGLGLATRS